MGDLKDRCVGRWRSMLPALGVPATHLTGKHGPCPICQEGKDRFRFDDKEGSGSFYCTKCGAGSGVDLVMRVNRIDFRTAKARIEEQLPGSSVHVRKAQQSGTFSCPNFWAMCHPVRDGDPVALYLAKRGLSLPRYPNLIRHHPRAHYRHDDGAITYHPAMVCKYVSPDKKDFTLHMTFLDAEGNKAKVPQVRKLAPRAVPRGGAVRLANSADTMGIAEGIETALSASVLNDVPVWSALSSGQLVNWEPPDTARNIIIFGDRDPGFGGQAAAYALAHKLKTNGRRVEVRIPDLDGTDWNDVLQSERARA